MGGESKHQWSILLFSPLCVDFKRSISTSCYGQTTLSLPKSLWSIFQTPTTLEVTCIWHRFWSLLTKLYDCKSITTDLIATIPETQAYVHTHIYKLFTQHLGRRKTKHPNVTETLTVIGWSTHSQSFSPSKPYFDSKVKLCQQEKSLPKLIGCLWHIWSQTSTSYGSLNIARFTKSL